MGVGVFSGLGSFFFLLPVELPVELAFFLFFSFLLSVFSVFFGGERKQVDAAYGRGEKEAVSRHEVSSKLTRDIERVGSRRTRLDVRFRDPRRGGGGKGGLAFRGRDDGEGKGKSGRV